MNGEKYLRALATELGVPVPTERETSRTGLPATEAPANTTRRAEKTGDRD
jgi:hypothetical protein